MSHTHHWHHVGHTVDKDGGPWIYTDHTTPPVYACCHCGRLELQEGETPVREQDVVWTKQEDRETYQAQGEIRARRNRKSNITTYHKEQSE